MKWVKKNPLGAALAGVVGLILFIGILSSLGSDTATTTTTALAAQETPGSTAATASDSVDRPEVDPVNCSPLITLEEVDEALGVTGQNLSIITFGGGETCTEVLADDDDMFVQIGPGDPTDFESGALVKGVTGDVVTDVGDDARWFTEAEGGVGVLSVQQMTSLGVLNYRVTLGRPGVGGSEQLDILRTLALAALPRFPGVEVEQPEPVVITFESEPVDTSNLGYVENLAEKEKAGEWTLGEGLVATLSHFAGEIEADQVLRNPDLVDDSGTGAMRMALEYAESGPDAEAKAEIVRLLDLLIIPRDELETLTAAELAPLVVSLQPVSLGTTAQESDVCSLWAGLACWTYSIDLDLDAMFGEGKYKLWHPDIPPDGEVGGWTFDDVVLALDAMNATAIKYETLGEMPSVDLTFRPLTNSKGFALPSVGLRGGGETCGVYINTPLQSLPEEFFKQWIAAAMAFCLTDANYEQIAGWWEFGLSIYLSEWVFSQANFEHEKFPGVLEQQELGTTLFDRTQTNWAFFEELHAGGGVGTVLGLIEYLQKSDLASFGGIDNTFHNFKKHLTDGQLLDIGGLRPPYTPDTRTLALSGPRKVSQTVSPFGVFRMHVTVPGGKVACVTYDEQGELRSSWRKGEPGSSGGGWSSDLREELRGESVFVVTATQPGARFNMDVRKVADDDDGCEEEDENAAPGTCLADLICDPSDYYTSALGQ